MKELGIVPSYGISKEYDLIRNTENQGEFYDEYLSDAYSRASDTQKANFDKHWTRFTTPNADGKRYAAVSTSTYTGKYSKIFTLQDGLTKATVTIPKDTSGNNSRNLIVVVKPYNRSANPHAKAVITPLAPAEIYK